MTGLEEAILAARVFFQDEGIKKSTVWKKSKERRYTRLRAFCSAYLRAKDHKRYSYPVIAKAIKVKDHTTAINAKDRAHEMWGADLFVRLAAVRVVANVGAKVYSPNRQQIIRAGEANMRIMMATPQVA